MLIKLINQKIKQMKKILNYNFNKVIKKNFNK